VYKPDSNLITPQTYILILHKIPYNSYFKHSIEFEQNDISILLIERGANVNIANGLLLYKSIYHDTFVITKKLIEYGAEIHDYLFVWDCKYGNVDIVKYLVSLGIKNMRLGFTNCVI
jgi:ankyrin repeat protein